MFRIIKLVYFIYCADSFIVGLVRDQIVKILFSEFYARVDEILCFIAGSPTIIEKSKNQILKCGSKFKVVEEGPHDKTAERFALSKLKKYVTDEDKIFYLHSKGITKPMNENLRDWRTLMEYGIFVKHKDCIRLLDTYDIVSTQWQLYPQPHFSGNIWCATGKYLLTLPTQIGPEYTDPEFWIGLNSPKVYSIWNSHIDHYYENYPPCKYVDQPWNL